MKGSFTVEILKKKRKSILSAKNYAQVQHIPFFFPTKLLSETTQQANHLQAVSNYNEELPTSFFPIF